jgi:Tol biopolymer transport system component
LIRAAAPLALALAAGLAAAQPYDPAYRWRTLETEHFRVHFHQGEEALAGAVAREAERAHARLAPLLGYAPPGRTEVVLSDDVDLANGSATPLPYNTIRLYAAPPESLSELNGFRDWLSVLVFHEYVHVLQLDQAGGLPGLFNAIFGKLWLPNGLLPAWAVEGVAVQHEGDGDGSPGRNGNALFDMYARALATEGDGLPPLEVLSNPMLEWPRGNAPYLLGGRFFEFLERRYGTEAMAGFFREQGTQIWPWAPSWSAERWFRGRGLPALWDEFRDEAAGRHRAQLARVRERPVTRPTPLTRRGARVENPRWAPDGSWIAFFDRSLDERAGLRRVTPAGRDLGRAVDLELNGTFALRSVRTAVAAATEVWREHRLYDDLWLVDLVEGRKRRLTDGERATDPDLLPGGDAVVYVARSGPGTHALRRRPLRGDALGEAETLFEQPGALVYLPRISPDGRRIAFELHRDGRRDIALWEDGEVRKVTDDDAVDLSPAWSPDGRWLLFASDRGGIHNLYAAEVPAPGVLPDPERPVLRQVTNVETGALLPALSPDGKSIAFVGYSRAGYDLATIPFDPASWIEPPPVPGPVPFDDPREGPLTAPPARPYRPWATLAPTFWLPLLLGDPEGCALGALTAGRDVVGHHGWVLQGWFGLESGQAGYAASYLGGWSWPRVDLSSSRFLASSPGEPDRLQSVWTVADAGLAFTFTRVDRALTLRLGWAGTIYDSLEPYDPAAADPAELFEDGFLSSASLAISYSDARRYARSISPEEGRTLSLLLSLAAPEIGSDFALGRAQGAAAGYLRLPGTRHAVLAARLGGGVSRGTVGGRAPFALGGIPAPDLLGLLLLGGPGPSNQLRGYPSGALEGDAYLLANLELRFPVAAPQWGRSTWPAFLRRLHGAVFVDAGDAFALADDPPFESHPFSWDRIRFGAGAEIGLETFLAYYLQADLRLGVARGLGPLLAPWDGGPPDDPDAVWQVYLTIGAPF